MKKFICIFTAVLLTASLASCNGNQEIELKTDEHGHNIADGHTHANEIVTDEHGHDISDGHTHANEIVTDEHGHDISDGHTHVHIETPEVIVSDLKETFNKDEDTAYQDLFFNKNTGAYENKTFTKYGTFGKIYDAYNDTERYYVWGYADTTKTSCYQWEFVMPDNTAVPADGSYIKVEGTMKHSDNALDKYWLTDVTLSVEQEFAAPAVDYDFVTMSPTLAWVQIQNMLGKSDMFKNVSVRMPAYIMTENTLCSVFNNSSWSLHYTDSSSSVKAADYVIIDGIFNETGTDTLIKIISAQPIG